MKFCVDLEKHMMRNIFFFELLTSWQNLFNIGEFVSSILMDLLKAYDFLKDNLFLP